MSTKKLPDHDEDGNDLVPPDPKSDVGQLIYLLEYGRQRGFKIGPTVQIGNVTVQVQDLRLPELRQSAEPDIFEQHGHKEQP